MSQCGDSIFQIGLLWLVLELSGSEAVTGLVAMASFLPAVILSLYAGVIADRKDKRRIMLTADGFRTVILLVIPMLYLTGKLSPLFLAINAFALAIAATFFNPARDALIPRIVPADGLVRANSLIQTSWQLSLLLGPALAGVLLYTAGNIHLFTVDSGAYLLSFLFVFAISNNLKTGKHRQKSSSFNEIREGLTYVMRHKVILPLLLITVADNLFIMGPAIVGTPVIVKMELGLGAEAYALISGCYAVGMLIGTAGLLTLGSRIPKGRMLLIGMIFDGLTFIPIFWVKSIEMLALIIIVHSIAIPLLTVSRASLIQSLVPAGYTGRVFALLNLSVTGMSALSAGATGIIIESIGVKTVFLLIGAGGALCGAVGWMFARDLKAAE